MTTWIFGVALIVVAGSVFWISRKVAYKPKRHDITVVAHDFGLGHGIEILSVTPPSQGATRRDEIVWHVFCNSEPVPFSILFKDEERGPKSPVEGPADNRKAKTKKNDASSTKPDKVNKDCPNGTYGYTVTVGTAVLDPDIRIHDEA
jgi:hypothetical protein